MSDPENTTAGAAPAPYRVETSRTASHNGLPHVYIVDANGRKIAAVWGKAQERFHTAELLVAAANALTSPTTVTGIGADGYLALADDEGKAQDPRPDPSGLGRLHRCSGHRRQCGSQSERKAMTHHSPDPGNMVRPARQQGDMT